jgi:hypothetical protein
VRTKLVNGIEFKSETAGVWTGVSQSAVYWVRPHHTLKTKYTLTKCIGDTTTTIQHGGTIGELLAVAAERIHKENKPKPPETQYGRLSRMVEASERAVETNRTSPATADLVLRLVFAIGRESEKLRKAIADHNQQVTSQVASWQGNLASSAVCGGGGWGTRTERARDRTSQSEFMIRPDSGRLAKLDGCKTTAEVLSERMNLFAALVERFNTLRNLSVRFPNGFKPSDSYHADTLSMIIASIPGRRWRGRLSKFHHYDHVHGEVLHRINRGNLDRRMLCRSPKATKRRGLNGYDRTRIVSNKRGEELFCGLTKPPVIEASPDLFRRAIMRVWCERLPQYGEVRERLEAIHTELIGPQSGTVRKPTLTLHNTRALLKAYRHLKFHGANQRVLARIRDTVFCSGQSTVGQYVISRPEIVEQNVAISFRLMTSDSADRFAHWQSVRCNLAAVRVIDHESGELSTEYQFCGFPEMPDSMKACLERLTPYHIPDLSDTHRRLGSVIRANRDFNLAAIVQELNDRLWLIVNPPVPRFGSSSGLTAEQRAEQQRLQRARVADYARRLIKIPLVSLQDSYNVGNCKPGTEAFCRELGVTVETMSGRELFQAWKSKAYPLNSLFLRVIDKLSPAVATEAESAGV